MKSLFPLGLIVQMLPAAGAIVLAVPGFGSISAVLPSSGSITSILSSGTITQLTPPAGAIKKDP